MAIRLGLGLPQLPQLRELAAERGRTKPVQTVLQVNAQPTAAPYEGRDRRPFQGSVEQVVADLAAHAAVGPEEILLGLQGRARDAEELKDLAAEVYTAARAAGI
ncbi:hypothetical protein [Streptomyces sp. NPDC048612]|uniref:hypothetical protein n=1 Tax=Streptomyces sp. NPDC048612 TaxID=3365579 RepID=UPI00371ABB54